MDEQPGDSKTFSVRIAGQEIGVVSGETLLEFGDAFFVLGPLRAGTKKRLIRGAYDRHGGLEVVELIKQDGPPKFNMDLFSD